MLKQVITRAIRRIKEFFLEIFSKIGIIKHTVYKDTIPTEMGTTSIPMQNDFNTLYFVGRMIYRVISYTNRNENYYTTRKGKKIYDYNEVHNIDRWDRKIILHAYPISVRFRVKNETIPLKMEENLFISSVKVDYDDFENGEIIRLFRIDIERLRNCAVHKVLFHSSESNDIGFNLPEYVKRARDEMRKELENLIESEKLVEVKADV